MKRHIDVCLLTVRLQAHERLTHWASRGALDIEGMGNEIVTRLIESGNLTDVADYYDLAAGHVGAFGYWSHHHQRASGLSWALWWHRS